MLSVIENMASDCWLLFSAVLSLCLGSFINVVIYRLPKMLEREEDERVNGRHPDVFNFFCQRQRVRIV